MNRFAPWSRLETAFSTQLGLLHRRGGIPASNPEILRRIQNRPKAFVCDGIESPSLKVRLNRAYAYGRGTHYSVAQVTTTRPLAHMHPNQPCYQDCEVELSKNSFSHRSVTSLQGQRCYIAITYCRDGSQTKVYED